MDKVVKAPIYWAALIAAAAFIVGKLAFGLTWDWGYLILILVSPWILFLALVFLASIVVLVLGALIAFGKGLRGK